MKKILCVVAMLLLASEAQASWQLQCHGGVCAWVWIPDPVVIPPVIPPVYVPRAIPPAVVYAPSPLLAPGPVYVPPLAPRYYYHHWRHY